MKKFKKLLAALISFAMIASVMMVPVSAEAPATAETTDADATAGDVEGADAADGAEEDVPLTAGEICEALGLLIGDTDAGVDETYLAKASTRAQLAILNARWMGYEDDAYAFEDWSDEENFVDFADGTSVVEQNMLAYYWVNEDLGFVGTGNQMFEPQGAILNSHFAKVLLVSMGYPYGDEYDMSDVLDFAADLGINLGSTEVEINNSDIAEALVEALEAQTGGEEGETFAKMLLDMELVDEQALIDCGIQYLPEGEDPGEVTDYPDTFEVSNHNAVSFSEVDLQLNAPIDEASIVKANIKVDGTAIGSSDKAYVVPDLENGAVLRIYMKDGFVGAQNETRTIGVSGLKNPEGTVMTAFSQSILFRDSIAPSVEKVVAKGNTRLDIYFTEPIKGSAHTLLSTYQINDKNISGVKPTINDTADTNTSRIVTINKIYTTLTPGTYTLGVQGSGSKIADWAGNSAGYQRIDFEIVEDSIGPIAQTVLDPVYPNKVQIEFDEEITTDATISWTENARTYTSSKVTVDEKTPNIATFEFNGNSTHKILPLRATTITLNGAKDYSGNAAQAPLTFDVTPVADTVRPTIVGYGADDESKIWVEFDKDLYNDAKFGKWSIKKGDDTIYTDTLNFAFDTDSTKKLIITKLDKKPFDTGDYVFTVSDTQDTAQPQRNYLLETTFTVTVPDKTAPTISQSTGVYWLNPAVSSGTGYQVINVYYSEKVDFSTATTRANYKIDKGNGSFINLPNTATVELMSGDRLVRITFDNATAAFIRNSAAGSTSAEATDGWVYDKIRLQVADVQDQAGNTISLSFYNVNAIASISTRTYTATATDSNTIKLKQTAVAGTSMIPITTLALEDFIVVNAVTNADTGIEVTAVDLEDENSTVVIDIDATLNADGTYGTARTPISVRPQTTSELNGKVYPIGDAIAPQMLAAFWNDDPNDLYNYTTTAGNNLYLVFDEKVQPTTKVAGQLSSWNDMFGQVQIDSAIYLPGDLYDGSTTRSVNWTVAYDGNYSTSADDTVYTVAVIRFGGSATDAAISHENIIATHRAYGAQTLTDVANNNMAYKAITVENCSTVVQPDP